MTVRELDAAAVHDPALRAAYARCRTLNARHGRTYFLATRLLPVDRRPAVHALYGFARHADDIVDDLDSTASPGERARALLALEAQLESGLRRTGAVTEPVILALSDTVRRYGIDHRHFTDFLASMRSDLTVGGYASYEELGRYTHGSAAVIGLQMLPVLGTVGPREEAAPHAAALGVAFQLTNFLRDVGEDLDRAGSTSRPSCWAPTGWTGSGSSGVGGRGRGTRGSPMCCGPPPPTTGPSTGTPCPGSQCSTRCHGPASVRRPCSTAAFSTPSRPTATRSSTAGRSCRADGGRSWRWTGWSGRSPRAEHSGTPPARSRSPAPPGPG